MSADSTIRRSNDSRCNDSTHSRLNASPLHRSSVPAIQRFNDVTIHRLITLLALTALALTSCTKQSAPSVLAKVGSSEIRLEDFQEQMLRRGGARPDALDKNALLEEMIANEALYVRALQAGLANDPDVKRAWRNLLIGKLKERELDARIRNAEITPAEIQAYYEQNRERYARPAKARLAVLFLKTEPLMKAEKIAELQSLLAEAREKTLGASGPAPERGFGPLAIDYSEDQATRYKGGDIGWVEAGRQHPRWSPAVVQAGLALTQVGEVSGVITDQNGIQLVRLMERRDADVVPLKEVEAVIRQRLLSEKRRQLEQSFTADARKSVPVEAHPELLANIKAPVAAKAAPRESGPPALP